MECCLESNDLSLQTVGGPLDAALATRCMSSALGSTSNSPTRRCQITCELYHLLEHCTNGLKRIKMPRSAKTSVCARPKRTTTGSDSNGVMSASALPVELASGFPSMGAEEGGKWAGYAHLRMMM